MLTNRRHFLNLSAGSTLTAMGSLVPGESIASSYRNAATRHSASSHRRPRVAVIMTVMTPRSHAHVIMENFLHPYMFNGKKTDPGVDVVSFYVDQFPKADMAKSVAKEYSIPIFPTIEEAICLEKKQPQVDAVLLIGEHGDYPRDSLGRHQYPRKRFFDAILAAIRKGDRGLPIFNDKHLSYRWDWTREMYDAASKQKCPLMAGSSVPLAQRIPNLEIEKGAEIEEALSIHGGGVESYDFHGLEVLQSMVENRKGGETGVSSVQFLDSETLQEKFDSGEISRKLFDAAMRTFDPEQKLKFEQIMPQAHGILLRYKDGLKASCVSIKQAAGIRWPFACYLKNDPEPKATRFYVGPWENRNLFKALSHAIQVHFRNQEAPYPVERTLLTSGIVNFTMDSRHQGGKALPTPELEIRYQAKDFRGMREMGETWKHLTPGTPQPKGLHDQFGFRKNNIQNGNKIAIILRRQKTDTVNVYLKVGRAYVNGKSINSGEFGEIMKKSGLKRVAIAAEPEVLHETVVQWAQHAHDVGINKITLSMVEDGDGR